MNDYILTLAGICVGIFFALLFAFVLSFQGCSVAPRSEVYCIKKGDWVKCPKGTPAGTILDKGGANAKK